MTDNHLETDHKKLTEGSISKNLFKLAMPTMAGFMFQMMYDLVDLAWIGMISAKAVAGVTIFATMFWLVNILNEIIGTSSVSLISQAYGKGDQDKTSLCVEQTLTFKAIVGLLAAIIFSVLLYPLLGFFTQDPEVRKAALDYGYIRIFFIPIMFSAYTINTSYRCVGDAKKPMYLMMISALLNVILDPILMFETIPFTNIPGFGMGVFGAALATVISIAAAFLVGAIMVLSNKTKVKVNLKRLFKLNWEIDKKLLTIGLPSGVEVLLRNLVNIATLKFVSIYGTSAVAAMGIGGRLFEFAFMPLLGLAMAGSTIVGQSLGQDNVHRAKQTARMAALYGFLFMLLFAGIIAINTEGILRIFIADQEVIDIGSTMLRIVMPGMVSVSIMMGIGSVFSGSGYNKPFLFSSIVGKWCVQIPMLFLVVWLLKLPVHFVWITFLLSDFTEMCVVLYFYKQGKWEKNRV